MVSQINRTPKVVLLLFLAFCFAGTKGYSQTNLFWGDSLIVQTTPHYITAPRMELLGDGTPVVVWGESSNFTRIWCSRLENGQFSAPISAISTAIQPSLFGFGGFDIAVVGQQLFVVFERFGSGIYLAQSEDGGQSFLPPVTVQNAIVGGYVTLANIAADESGNIFVNYIQEKNGRATHQLRRSTDGGQTFGDAVDASAPADGSAVCECCIAAPFAAAGKVWLAFRNNNTNLRDHWVSQSADLGATFETAADIDNSDWQINVCPISSPRIAMSGDSLMVIWKTGAFGGSKIFVSSIHAQTMNLGQQIPAGVAGQISDNQNQPDIVAAGDTIGIVFEEGTRLTFAYTVSGLAGLSEYHTLPGSDAHTLRYPSLAFDAEHFHLVYVNSNTGELIYRRSHFLPAVGVSDDASVPAHSVEVYPNPLVDGRLRIQSELHPLHAGTLFDIFGNQLFQWPLNGNLEQLDLVNLPGGMYFLKIELKPGTTILKKLVIER